MNNLIKFILIDSKGIFPELHVDDIIDEKTIKLLNRPIIVTANDGTDSILYTKDFGGTHTVTIICDQTDKIEYIDEYVGDIKNLLRPMRMIRTETNKKNKH